MDKGNQTTLTEFILLGFSDLGAHQKFLFVIFLMMYILTLCGNIIIITLVVKDSHLHTPMYYLLSCLSVVDIGFTSTTIPKLLLNLLLGAKIISFTGCFTQMFFFHSIGNMDSFLLALMAYDRYVAICRPLHYTMMMNIKLLLLLVSGSWVIVCLHSLQYTLRTSRLTYCGSNKIYHFYCEVAPLFKLSCSDLKIITLIVTVEAGFILCIPVLCVVISYGHIINTIIKMPTAVAKLSTFSTCSSHLAVVTLAYGSAVSVYVRPPSSTSVLSDRFLSMMYNAVTPMLNPFIYCLRNKEVIGALRKALGR
ncbi:olfactory receptor 1C1-like [Pleurodeles waltl]|uniref:olfactory receptor 1C1-like n=1 Tax=Pleurodeles waltl TaxID=8319 RepID=UPI003709937C